MIIYSKPLIGPNFFFASAEDLIGNFDSPEPGSLLVIMKEKDGCTLCQGVIMASGLISYNNLYNYFLKSKLNEKEENESMSSIGSVEPNNELLGIKSGLDDLHETINKETDSKIDEVAKLVDNKFDKTIDHFNLIKSDLLSVYSEDRKEIRKRLDSNDRVLHKLWIINIISTIAVVISSISAISSIIVLLSLYLF